MNCLCPCRIAKIPLKSVLKVWEHTEAFKADSPGTSRFACHYKSVWEIKPPLLLSFGIRRLSEVPQMWIIVHAVVKSDSFLKRWLLFISTWLLQMQRIKDRNMLTAVRRQYLELAIV